MTPGKGRKKLRRPVVGCGVAAVGLLALLLVSFALPVRVWRTGELPAPPLPTVPGGPEVALPGRIWIDTDAACGRSRTTDPDDCFALALLLESPELEVVGVSTVFGNAPLAVTDRTTRALVAAATDTTGGTVAVHRGASARLSEEGAEVTPASQALTSALEAGPLTIVALGPLTNVAAVLDHHPELEARVGRVVAVMGRRPGHLFHPAEGEGEGAILFGHGPVFRDLNYEADPEAAARVLARRLPVTLIPYEVARQVLVTEQSLAQLTASGGAFAWAAERAEGWLAFWREEIGVDGFYPFDLLAAIYVLDLAAFDCGEVWAWVAPDDVLWRLWFQDPLSLLVGGREAVPAEARTRARVIYCPAIAAGDAGGFPEWTRRR